MKRRKTVSVTPAIGASTVAGATPIGPMANLAGKCGMTWNLYSTWGHTGNEIASWFVRVGRDFDQMKPVQIGVLVLVGAMGGALIMRFSQRQAHGIVPAPIVEQTPVATPPPVVAPPTVAEAPVAEEAPVAQEVPAADPTAMATPPRSAFPKKVAHTPVHHPKATHEPVTTIAQSVTPAPVEPVQNAAPEPVAPPTPAAPEPAPEPAVMPAPEPAPPPAPTVTLRAGTLLPVRLGENLSSEHNQAGDGFTATLDGPLVVDGFVIAERGARVEGRVIEAEKASHVKGQPTLALELTKLNTSDGQHVGIQTDAFRKQAVKSTQQDVGIVAAAAGVGAIIGAMAGGGKGAGIGAAAGGAAGTGGVIATRAKAVALSSESKISFRLRQPVTLTEQRNH